MDFLPIQASAVPSERVFSSGAETDTSKRNRINPVLMEALQMLKFGLKKARLDFTAGWITDIKQMEETVVAERDVDLLAGLIDVDGASSAMDILIASLAEDGDDDTEMAELVF